MQSGFVHISGFRRWSKRPWWKFWGRKPFDPNGNFPLLDSHPKQVPPGVGISMVTYDELEPGQNGTMSYDTMRQMNGDLAYAMDHLAMAHERLVDLHMRLCREGKLRDATYLDLHGKDVIGVALIEVMAINLKSPLPKLRQRANFFMYPNRGFRKQ